MSPVVRGSYWWAETYPDWAATRTSDGNVSLELLGSDDLKFVFHESVAPRAEVRAVELRLMMAETTPAGVTEVPKRVQCGDFAGFHIRFVDKGIAWQMWWLCAGRVLLFVTLLCPPARAASYDAAAVPILASLHADTAPAALVPVTPSPSYLRGYAWGQVVGRVLAGLIRHRWIALAAIVIVLVTLILWR